MCNVDEKKSLLETILGAELIIPKSHIVQPVQNNNMGQDILNIVSNDLFASLANYFDRDAPYFKTSLSLDKIVRYKDGSFSSMEKSAKAGFSKHQGFDIVNGFDIAQQLMTCVVPVVNQRLASIYNDLIEQNHHYMTQFQDFLIMPEISKLKSIAEFLKEVSDDISDISKSDRLSSATLTNVQRQRIDLKQIFYLFTDRLEQSLFAPIFEPENVANNYLVAIYSLSNYIVSLVLECIVSGNIDDQSVQKLEAKVEECFTRLNSITTRLSMVLENKRIANSNEINSINLFYSWSYDYLTQHQLSNLHYQNSSIDSIRNHTLKYFDISHEKERLKAFVKARYDAAKFIKITKS